MERLAADNSSGELSLTIMLGGPFPLSFGSGRVLEAAPFSTDSSSFLAADNSSGEFSSTVVLGGPFPLSFGSGRVLEAASPFSVDSFLVSVPF